MDRASLKLAKIIDILEKEIQIREYCKIQKNRGISISGQSKNSNLDILDDDSSCDDSQNSDTDDTKSMSKKDGGSGITTNITLPVIQKKILRSNVNNRSAKPTSAKIK